MPVPKSQLVGEVVAAGCRAPSDDLLKRLAREGLLPRPRQLHPGRARGSISVYPTHAVEQAIGVLRLHEEVHRFDRLRFWAFWDGYWVESRQLKRTLSRQIKPLFPRIHETEDPFDSVESLVYSVPGDELASRMRFGKPELAQSAMLAVVLGAKGGDPGWDFQPLQDTTATFEDEPTPARLAERFLGLKSLVEPIGTFGPVVDTPPDPRLVLDQIARTGLGDPTQWARLIRETPLAELTRARETAKVLTEDLAYLVQTAQERMDMTLPTALTRIAAVPSGRGARAVRARIQMIPLGIAVNRLDSQQVVSQNLEAIRSGAEAMRQAQ